MERAFVTSLLPCPSLNEKSLRLLTEFCAFPNLCLLSYFFGESSRYSSHLCFLSLTRCLSKRGASLFSFGVLDHPSGWSPQGRSLQLCILPYFSERPLVSVYSRSPAVLVIMLALKRELSPSSHGVLHSLHLCIPSYDSERHLVTFGESFRYANGCSTRRSPAPSRAHRSPPERGGAGSGLS